MDRIHKTLIAGGPGVGKTVLALSYCQQPNAGDVLYLDQERGGDYYVVDKPEQAKPEEFLFHVHRVKAPNLYNIRFLMERLRYPERPGKELIVCRAPADLNLLSPEVKSLNNRIAKGELKIGTVVLDTVTRLCEQATRNELETRILKHGPKADSLNQLTWVAVKDDVSEALYAMIESGCNVILTAWAKNAYDKDARASTNEVIADVLKNVPYFVDLSLLLEPNPRPKGSATITPRALVQKSRMRNLPEGAVVPQATWENILKFEPRLEEVG